MTMLHWMRVFVVIYLLSTDVFGKDGKFKTSEYNKTMQLQFKPASEYPDYPDNWVPKVEEKLMKYWRPKLTETNIASWHLEGRRFVMVQNYKKSPRVVIRQFYLHDADWRPTKKGISLTAEQWKRLEKLMPIVDQVILKNRV